jgi:drug/metabolite transporter (DMT)-like permease
MHCLGTAAVQPLDRRSPLSPAPSRTLHAIGLMLVAVFCFATLDAISKHLAQIFAVPLLAWARYAVHLVIMLAVLGPSMRGGLLRTTRPLAQVVRSLMLVGTTVFFMAAFRIMPLAETTALSFVAPLLVAFAAGPLLQEKIGAARWAAILSGFAGVLLIAHIGAGSSEIPVAGLGFALAGAVCYAVYQLQTRQLSPSENTLTMLFYTALCGTLALTLPLPWVWGGPRPDTGEVVMIAALGVLGGTGHLLLTRAFRYAPASLLSPFSYAQLLWATLLGWLAFDQVPDTRSLIGIACIFAGGLGLVLGERRRSRAADRGSERQ